MDKVTYFTIYIYRFYLLKTSVCGLVETPYKKDEAYIRQVNINI